MPLVLLVLCCLFSFATLSPRGDAAALNKEALARTLASSPLTQEQQALHVLNRLAYGSRPGDIEKVKAIGLAEYIAQQLNPASVDDSALGRRLSGLETLEKSARELADKFLPTKQAKKKSGLPDKGKQTGPSGDRSPETEAARRKGMEGFRKVALELQQAKILRATYSERQLQEVMTDFWFNHFNVFIGKGADRILTTEYERDVIRPNTLGKFQDLLVATSKSPAMLFYLDNWMSVDPHAKLPARGKNRRNRLRNDAQGTAGMPQARAKNKRLRGLNENYARELMELHTLGVDGGYTQKDVTEVARCFTGWTLRNPRAGGGFQFVSNLHDNGEKVVLGKKIPANGGMKDGEIVLEMLSKHPSTARFVSTKLCRRFVADEPPESLIQRCSDTFQKTGGDIPQVLAAIFTSPEFYSLEAFRAKMKKPFELVASALRATGAETAAPPMVALSLRSMGEFLYGCQPPTGYPDTAEAWINTGALLERMNFATALTAGRIPGTRLRLDPFAGSARDTASLVATLSRTILNDEPRKEFLQAIQKQLEAAELDSSSDSSQKATRIAGLILGSPEFQRR